MKIDVFDLFKFSQMDRDRKILLLILIVKYFLEKLTKNLALLVPSSIAPTKGPVILFIFTCNA